MPVSQRNKQKKVLFRPLISTIHELDLIVNNSAQ